MKIISMARILNARNRYLKNASIFFLNVTIGIYLILIPLILISGGFETSFLGFSIKANRIVKPTYILLGLFLIKSVIVLERKNFLLLLASLFIALFSMEIALRVYPAILGDLFANKVLSKYHTRYDGIYEYDPIVKMNFMKPNFETTAYWNRYKWHHKTDSWGFRNAVDRNSTDIVLLGDSLIYGHGVNQNQTVGYFLEKITKHSVMNLGRQGDCSFQEMYILNKYGPIFKPRYALYFFSPNDINDLSIYLSQDEMKQFVDTPIEEITFKDRSVQKRVTYSRFEKVIKAIRKDFYITELLNYVHYLFKIKMAHADTGKSLEWQYTEKAILQMNHFCNENSTVFIIVPIFCNIAQYDILEKLAFEHSIPFIDTRIINNVESFRLPHDGHLSGEGALALAKIVAEYMSKTRIRLE